MASWTPTVSSPRTRGSSVAGLPHRPHPDVVPAHAGVIPGTARMQWVLHCRPRARGGHPRRLPSPARPPPSSPRTRGSSPHPVADQRGGVVVPAHAGVIPRAWPCRCGRGRRPRARGGHPGTSTTWSPTSASSPRTRGSSAAPHPPQGADRVVPAHAGVIRAAPTSTPCTACRPRARGGHPWWCYHRQGRHLSSPRTRGSCRCAGRCGPTGPVVPAHAGVIPVPSGSASTVGGRPRARGGHPPGHR